MFVPSDKHPGIGQKELAAVAREVGEHFTGKYSHIPAATYMSSFYMYIYVNR